MPPKSNTPPLEICPDCGWYDHWIRNDRGQVFCDRTERECHPRRGKLADQLFARLPETVPTTKLGYGIGRIAIGTLDDGPGATDGIVVVFDVDDDTFRLKDVTVLGELSLADAQDLAQSLLSWCARKQARRAHAQASLDPATQP